MPKHKVEITRSRYAGPGVNGGEYEVATVLTKGGTHRRKPCDTCPWRKDSEVGVFPAEAFRHSADTSYDMSGSTFACHESGVEKTAVCAGFLLTNADHNLAVRLGRSTGKIKEVSNPDNVPLYSGYREMAIANGVDPDDPVLQRCRANGESYR